MQIGTANAREGYWQGDVSTEWNLAGNWFVIGAPGDGGFVPQASSGFNVRAVIGTDSPSGALNTTLGNSPVLSAALPTAKATIGGVYLGVRERDFTLNPPPFVNPAPAAGALVGKLTISGGTLNNISTGDAAFGADGRIVVGADGRGFLTMTGGTLNGQQLVVGGENFTGDALGTSMVDLSGSALLAINNAAVAANGTAALDRRLKISGPNARLTTGGTVTFGSTSSFTAVFTSAANAAGPAMIQSAAAIKMGGALNVEFSGAGATGHALGNKWNLLTATTGVANNFTNLGVGNEITPSGLASPAPLGSAYYLRTVDGGSGKLVQVSYEGVLVLRVNRNTGELRITNPLGGNIAIDGYQVTSGRGSMVASYAGLGSSTPGAGVWLKGNNSATGLFEIKQPDMTPPIDNNDAYNLTSVPSVSLGTGFSRTGVAADISNFGQHGEDLVFSYTSPDGGIIRGQIVYENGTRFENNLVLRVNPNNGLATLKNDSLESLVFDGFEIASTNAALNIAGFAPITGGTGTWLTDAEGTTGLSQVNFTGARTLSPGQEVSIGDISSTNFLTDAAKSGLSMNFILAQGLESTTPSTDYSGNGIVDTADYTIWRDHLGATGVGQAQGDGNGDGNITQADYDLWKSQFGLTGVAGPETTFRAGTVIFDATLGSGGGSFAAAVPEPGTGLLLIAGLGSLAFTRRRKQSSEELNVDHSEQPVLENGQVGVRIMSRRVGLLALVAVGIVTMWNNGLTAVAATGGLPIVNFDMELPGPAGSKVIAFDNTGAPIPGIIPGWTFVGPGTTLWGDEVPGDSGTEGGGVPGNALLLNTNDGKVYQDSGHALINPMVNQQYRVSFNGWGVFSTYVEGSDPNLADGFRLTSRLYSGAYPGTTLMTQQILGGAASNYYEFLIPRDSPVLTGKLGQSLGIEFDVTSVEYSIAEDPSNTIRDIVESWAHIDNVVFELVGLIPGDLNGDGVVNTADASNLTPNLQRYTPFEAEGELTGDNVVNLNDFRALKNLIAAGSGSGGLAGSGSAVPEPSSLALLVAVFGIAGGALARVGRRGAYGRVLMLAVVAMASSLVLTAELNAELLLYEPFLIGANPAAGEYAADAPLAGQNPTLPNNGDYGTMPDLLSGPWIQPNAAYNTHALSRSTGLNYIGAPASGGSIGTVADPVDFGIDNRLGRKLKPGSEWTDATVGTYYIGWLQNFGGGDFMGYRAIEFWRDPNGEIGDSNLVGAVAYNQYYSPLGSVQTNPETARFYFNHQIIDGAPVFVEDGATHLFVLKFVLSDVAASDTISVYLDPTSVTEPDLPNLTITGQDVQLGIIGIAQFGGSDENMNTVDELRIATLFSEVLPELPLPGDVDGDRDVDLDDYNVIIANLGLPVSSATLGDVAKSDGTQGSDGRVTIADYRIWKDHYPTLPPGAGGGALANSGVPEPSACLLIVIGMALAAVSAQRRGRASLRTVS